MLLKYTIECVASVNRYIDTMMWNKYVRLVFNCVIYLIFWHESTVKHLCMTHRHNPMFCNTSNWLKYESIERLVQRGRTVCPFETNIWRNLNNMIGFLDEFDETITSTTHFNKISVLFDFFFLAQLCVGLKQQKLLCVFFFTLCSVLQIEINLLRTIAQFIGFVFASLARYDFKSIVQNVSLTLQKWKKQYYVFIRSSINLFQFAKNVINHVKVECKYVIGAEKKHPRHGKFIFTNVDVYTHVETFADAFVQYWSCLVEKLIYGFRYMHIDSLYTLDQLIHDLATIE